MSLATPLDARLNRELERLRAQDLYRRRRPVEGRHGVLMTVEGRACINFCSNDYLGLASDPRLAEAATAALKKAGTGSGAAALISGYNREHAELEEALAAFLGMPRVLLFSSGWAANLGLLRALYGRDDTLVCDELNHASLIDGARLSGARYARVPHADVAGFAAALDHAAAQPGETGLVTDSVFSMDGDLADLPALSRLARTRNAALIVDDAHGFGVLGASGRGAIEHWAAKPPASLETGNGQLETAFAPDVYVATLGKSLGAAGAFVAGSEALIEYLIQRARTWVFSTAPPPAMAAAARCSLGIIAREPEHRLRLLANIARFRSGAAQLGIPLSPSLTAIQPLILGAAAQAMQLSRQLFERGYWVAAIRPPTVPAGTSRLRITLSAAHTPAQIDGLLEAVSSVQCPVVGAAAAGAAAPGFCGHSNAATGS
ncbi:MAG: 8-amino-7-oxononanoate synthase [Nevskia sp.]